MLGFAGRARVKGAGESSATALHAVVSLSQAASNAAPKSSVSSLSKAASESSATIRITGSSPRAIVQSRGGKISVCTPSHCGQTYVRKSACSRAGCASMPNNRILAPHRGQGTLGTSIRFAANTLIYLYGNTESLKLCLVGDSKMEASQIQHGEPRRLVMSAPTPLRQDFDAPQVRGLARKTKDGPQARRLLALAAIYDGATRTEAAKIGGVGLQIIRDWVL